MWCLCLFAFKERVCSMDRLATTLKKEAYIQVTWYTTLPDLVLNWLKHAEMRKNGSSNSQCTDSHQTAVVDL